MELSSPLDGVLVLDLGLAVAGPYGTQLLSDLGADVIKINTIYDMFWHTNHIAMMCNRGKRSLSVDLKSPRGMEILHRLVARADIVQHNMRYEAATRLGVDYASLRAIKPDLIYCHTRGFEHGRARERTGNDQTASAIAGQSYEDGGCANGGRPLWSTSSLGDLGNGFLSAIGILQALYHRDRTGVGQFVDTSILYACLLNTSYAWLDADGTPAQRPHLDGQELRITARYGLYPCAEGWLCVAAVRDDHWEALARALGHPDWLTDARFATTDAQAEHDADLVKLIEAELSTDTAARLVRSARRRGRTGRGVRRPIRIGRVRRSGAHRARMGDVVRAGNRRQGGSSRPVVRLLGDARPHRRAAARRGRPLRADPRGPRILR